MNFLQFVVLSFGCAVCLESLPTKENSEPTVAAAELPLPSVNFLGDFPTSIFDVFAGPSQNEQQGLRSVNLKEQRKDVLAAIHETVGALEKLSSWMNDTVHGKEDGGSLFEAVEEATELTQSLGKLLGRAKAFLPKEVLVVNKHNRAVTAPPSGLHICTWNVFRFGPKKFDEASEVAWEKKYKKRKVEMMAEQIKEADILALQEFFDPSLATLEKLKGALNKKTGSKWQHAIGERVGRVSKEQYVFLFRSEYASVIKNHTYPEPAGHDQFSREPFYAHFKVNKPGVDIKELVLGTVHTEPAKAVEEISSLIDSMNWANKEFKHEDVMTLGDYNADCQYLRKKDWDKVKLWTDKSYAWFIPEGTDTASMSSKCAFDRAVSKSPKIKAAFIRGSLRVLDFVDQYKIKVAEARQLSDHFPVCMTFK